MLWSAAHATPARPRVLHVGPLPPPWGGCAANLAYLLRAEALNGFDMQVLNTARSDYREDVSGDKRLWHVGRVLRGLKTCLDTWRAARLFRPAILHIQSAGPDASILRDLMLIPIGHRAGARVVFQQHFWPDRAKFRGPVRLYTSLYTRFIPTCDAVLMTTPLHIEQASAVVDVSRAHVFPNTCVPPDTAPCDRPIGDRAPAGRCQAVYVGRLSHLKGTYDLIAAIALILRSSIDFTFVLIGVGQTAEDDERVARLVAEHHFGDRVVLAGRVSDEDKWRILAESQVMVFPSLGELFPVTLVEGLAAGLPIVTTSVDYLPRLIVHGENGLVVPPGAPHDLANALLALSRDPEMRQRMSRANRLKFEKEFALDVVAGKLREVYQRILEDVR